MTVSDTTYLACDNCGWSVPITHTPEREGCPNCDGVLTPRDDELYSGRGIYRHYKGGVYEVLGLALHEHTVTKHAPDGSLTQVGEGHDEVVSVVYRPLSRGSILEDRPEELWARERGNFTTLVTVEGELVPRFTFLGTLGSMLADLLKQLHENGQLDA